MSGAVPGALRGPLAAEPLQPRVQHVLPALPVRAAGHFRQPRALRALLRQHDHPPQRHQVPLTSKALSLSSFREKKSACAGLFVEMKPELEIERES